ncbi:hypothetical protein TSAR_004363 [Trichomalopsis sarcophagae]|uniref:Uncharacterized protein n=1 Tax=Trichomalopsis sarcophagae TaxID=543379 RepID=A0A232EQB6_9HYME|nr:hypothetical protein TSAR_004363 [Trichomalopsis sarcophagae]
MEVDPILSDDDIQILEVRDVNASTSHQSPKPEVKRQVAPKSNPVEQNIAKQLNYVNDLLTRTKNNIKIIEDVTDSILNNISVKTSYQEGSSSSESDSDCYSSTGEPVIKKRKNQLHEKQQVIKVNKVWQLVVHDKWIIGVVLQNTTTCDGFPERIDGSGGGRRSVLAGQGENEEGEHARGQERTAQTGKDVPAYRHLLLWYTAALSSILIPDCRQDKLQEPTIYICHNNEEDSNGVFVFWTLLDDKIWIPTDEIGPQEEVIATVVLDLPSFDEKPVIQAHGTVFCQFDDKLFQTSLPDLELGVENTVDGSCDIDFEDENRARASVLALKVRCFDFARVSGLTINASSLFPMHQAISVDRVVLLPMQVNAGTRKRLTKFLDAYSFTEVCKVCVMRNVGALQYCLLEVLPIEDADIRVLLSARSEAQLSAIVQLMHEYLPELLDVEKQQAVDEAADALQQELLLYLTCNSTAELQRAKIRSDLLIP